MNPRMRMDPPRGPNIGPMGPGYGPSMRGPPPGPGTNSKFRDAIACPPIEIVNSKYIELTN